MTTTMSKLKGKAPKKAKVPKPKSIVFGASGVGKTWAALDFPHVYYIDTEGGANLPHYTDKLEKDGGAYFGPEDGSTSFAEVTEQVKALATEKHSFRTLIIDSLSKLFSSAILDEAIALEKAGKKNEFGLDKKGAIAKLKPLLQWIEKLDMNVILICHEAALWEGGEATGYKPDIWDKVVYDLHLSLRITKVGKSRYMIPIKSRLEEFPEGTPLAWSYDEFAKRYGRETIETEAVSAVSIASAETLAQLEKYIDLMKTDADDQAKWLKKANCESLKDLPEDIAVKIIKSLEAKIKT
jgi:hypothetical protein